MGKVYYTREPVCKKCGRMLQEASKVYCDECDRGIHQFEQGVSLFVHTGDIRNSIYDFKYKNRRDYADFFSREIVNNYGKYFEKWNIDAIIPVPIHKSREIKRGYNQAAEFAKQIARKTGILYDDKLIIRKNKTSPQKEFSDYMRYVNLRGAFGVDVSKAKRYRNVLIVDDIYTTGATIDACAYILKKAGIQKVYFACISAGVPVQRKNV